MQRLKSFGSTSSGSSDKSTNNPPASPTKLRGMFTGIAQPVSNQERDARWAAEIKFTGVKQAAATIDTNTQLKENKVPAGAFQRSVKAGTPPISGEAFAPTRTAVLANPGPSPSTPPPGGQREPFNHGYLNPITPRTKTINDAKYDFLNPGMRKPDLPSALVAGPRKEVLDSPKQPEVRSTPKQDPSFAAERPMPSSQPMKRPASSSGSAQSSASSHYERQARTPESSTLAREPQTPQAQIAHRRFPSFGKNLLSKSVGPTSSVVADREKRIAQDFEQMMKSIDCPASVRTKMLNLDLNTKEGMLAQRTKATPTESKSKSLLRRPRSFASLRSFSAQQEVDTPVSSKAVPDGFVLITPVPDKRPASPALSTRSRSNSVAAASPSHLANVLHSSNRKTLIPSTLVKLRMMLRNESVDWIQEWSDCDGYAGLLARLSEQLDLEWREEQRDDTLLHELLRCFRALLYSEVGRSCLASSAPSLFRSLVQLLYSDRKPGEVSTRQVMCEIICGLFDLTLPKLNTQLDWSAPLGSLPTTSTDLTQAAVIRTSKDRLFSSHPAHELAKQLLMGPEDEAEASRVDFIRQAHRSRRFKKFVLELTGLLSDYFWIFAHSNNTFLVFVDLDEDKFAAPQVPGGMTAGVEFEAMHYAVALLRLLNTLLASAPSPQDACAMLQDLTDSGIDKCIFTLRKSNPSYYRMVHFELARYVHIARQAGFPLVEKYARTMTTNGFVSAPAATPNKHKRSKTEGNATGSPFQLPKMEFEKK